MKHKRALRVFFLVVLLVSFLPKTTYATNGFFENVVCRATAFFGYHCAPAWEPMVVVVPAKVTSTVPQYVTPTTADTKTTSTSSKAKADVSKPTETVFNRITNYVTNPVTVVYKYLTLPEALPKPDTISYVSNSLFRKQNERTQDNASEQIRDSLASLSSSFETGAFSITGTFTDSLGSAGTSGFVLQSTGAGVRWVATSSLGIVGGGGGGDLSVIDVDTSSEFAAILGDETGTGNVVFSNSPTLVTPILGTPTSVMLTNATGLPISTGISGLGANVATFLGTPSSANLMGAVTDEVGSGSLVFSTSPSFTGNVGVGTTTPQTALHVDGGEFLISDDGVALNTRINSVSGEIAIFEAFDNYSNLSPRDMHFFAREWQVWTGDFSQESRLTITASGDVGIGTTSPSAPFAVSGLSNFAKGILLSGSISNIALGSNYLSGDGGDEGIFVDSSGNVGIGTSTPTAKLEVTGSTELHGFVTIDGITAMGDGDNHFVVKDDIGNLLFYISSSFGQTTATVNGGLQLTGALYDAGYSAGTSGYILQTTGTGTTWVATSTLGLLAPASIDTSSELAAILTNETGSGALVFGTAPTLSSTTISGILKLSSQTASRGLFTDSQSRATTTALSATILNSLTDETGTGVAVFGTSPTFSTGLTLSGATAVRSNINITTDTSYGEYVFQDNSTTKWGTGFYGDVAGGGRANDYYIYQYTDSADATVNQERFTIDTTGNVGIGVVAPMGALQINHAYESSIPGLGSPSAFFNLTHGSAWGLIAGTLNTGNVYLQAQRVDTTATAYHMLLQPSGGNVGIGTSTPADKLNVYGDIRVGTGTTGCVKDADGTTIAGTCSSDERLKTDITLLTDSNKSYLESIVALEPVTYRWNDFAAETFKYGTIDLQTGLIAQQVEETMPELVTTSFDGYKQVRFSELPIYLIQALRELWTIVTGNQEKIEVLEDRIEALERELNVPPPPISPNNTEGQSDTDTDTSTEDTNGNGGNTGNQASTTPEIIYDGEGDATSTDDGTDSVNPDSGSGTTSTSTIDTVTG